MKAVVFIVGMAILTSCGGSSNGSGGTGGGLSAFTEETKLETFDSTRFTVGCKKPGELYGESILKIDSRLKPGISFEGLVASTDEIGRAKKAIFETRVSQATVTTLETSHKIKSFEGISLQGIQNQSTTYYEESQGTIISQSRPFFFELQKEIHELNERCTIDLKERKSALSKGKFTFANSEKSVTAFKLSTAWLGMIECGGTPVEAGEYVEEVIFSNEVPALRNAFASCGGEKVHEHVSLKGQTGKIYWIKLNEILSVK